MQRYKAALCGLILLTPSSFSGAETAILLLTPDVLGSLLRGVAMNRSLSFIPVLSLIFLTLFSVSASATQQAQERRVAREVRQDTRDASRQVKQTCVANNNQSNHDCRQDKRQMKQSGRQKARDIKY